MSYQVRMRTTQAGPAGCFEAQTTRTVTREEGVQLVADGFADWVELTEEQEPAEETTEAPPAEETTEAPPAEETAEAPPAEETTEAPPAEETAEAPPAEETAARRSTPRKRGGG